MSNYEEPHSENKEPSSEDSYEEIHSKRKDDIYSDEGRELAVDDDEISAEEDGFMKGYEE